MDVYCVFTEEEDGYVVCVACSKPSPSGSSVVDMPVTG